MKRFSTNYPKLNVCLVYASGLSTERGGGIATKILNVIKQTIDEVNYTVLTTIEKIDYYAVNELIHLGVTVIDISAGLKSFKNFRNLLKSSHARFDIIHFHELPFAWNIEFSALVCLFLFRSNITTKYVYEHQIATAGNLHKLQITLQNVLFKAWFNVWSVLLFNSRYMLLESKTLVKDSSKFSIIPLGVDIKKINETLPIDLQKPAILFFGHLTRIKGVDLLVQAFEKVNCHYPNAHLYLLGNGNLTDYCKFFVKTHGLGDRVHILGAISQKSLFGFLKGCDVCVLPSRNDAGPLTLLEAMAAGKPIITTVVGFVPEIFVNGRNGLLVKCDVESIADAINFLIEHPRDRVASGENNFEDIAMYSWENASKKYMSLYKSLKFSA